MGGIGRSTFSVAALLSWCWAVAPADAQQREPARDALPPDFRGRITYEGHYTGTLTFAGRSPRRLDLRNIINSAMSARRDEIAGIMIFEVEFDGSTVRGIYRPTGRLGRSIFSGTRTGDQCQMSDPDGWPWVARCNRSGFSGSARSLRNQNPAVRLSFETNASSLVNADEEQRQRSAALRERARRPVELARPAPTVGTTSTPTQRRPQQRTASPIASGQDREEGERLREYLDRVLIADSQGWLPQRYRPGSLRIVQIGRGSYFGTSTYVTHNVRGEFLYQDGNPGWVRANFAGTRLHCIEIPNSFDTCRSPLTAEESTYWGRLRPND